MEVYEPKITDFKNYPLVIVDTQIDIDENAIEDLKPVVSSELKEDNEEGITCYIIKKSNNTLETSQYLNRNSNINDRIDLVEKDLSNVGVSIIPCPILMLHQECILMNTECSNEVRSNENANSPVRSKTKTSDGCERNTAENRANYGLQGSALDSQNSIKGFELTKPSSFTHSVTHSVVDNISKDFLTKKRLTKNSNDMLKDMLSKTNPNRGQGVFVNKSQNYRYKNTHNVVEDILYELVDNISWSQYKWQCQHCRFQCISMSVLREHSKLQHNKCCAYKCIDCEDLFISFIPFIEHVRQHRKSLRLYCPFCNEKFSTPKVCRNHSDNHWLASKTCDRCGEQLASTEELVKHNKQYKEAFCFAKYAKMKVKLVPEKKLFTWDNYKMACQACHLTAPDIETLRRHADEVHHKCFANKCADCLQVFRNFKTFVNHILQHRPWLKIPCQHCPETFSEEKALTAHIKSHETDSQKACNTCWQLFKGKLLQEHVVKYNVPGHKLITCDICFQNYISTEKLEHHKAHTHKSSLCELCGRSFNSTISLRNHVSYRHKQNKIKCQYCHLTFNQYYLKKHVQFHMNMSKQFVCDHCGKSFRGKGHLSSHITSVHMPKFVKCKLCKKQFKTTKSLKLHLLQHTGDKPHQCQICPLTFAYWGNCNAHMMRRHGVTLAKTKRTAVGRMQVNESGKLLDLELKDNVKQWMHEVAQGSRKKKCQG